MVHKVRAIHDQGAAIVTELIAALAVSERRVGIPDGDGMNGLSGDIGDVFRVNSMVDEMVIMNIEVVDDRGAVVNLRYMARCHAIAARMRVAKMPNRHKRETIPAQAEIETDADGDPVKKESNAFPVHRARRQRRPAAVIVRIPPGHP